MKTEIIKDKLSEAVFKAEKISGRNMSLPVLNCLFLEAKEKELVIKATNLDLGIEIKVPAKTEQKGIVCVPAGILNNFISNISSDKSIVFEVKEGNLKVSTSKNSTLIKGVNYEDFPNIPVVEGGDIFKIDPKYIIKGLKSVYFSASNSNIKPELSSVMVENKDGYIYFVATDSFRLAEKKVSNKSVKNELHQILIPIRNIPEIIRNLDGVNEDVEVSLNKNQISFSFNGYYITSRVIDGTFPDYKQLFPKEFKTEVVLLKQDFLNAMKMSTVFSDKFNQITFKADPKAKKFTVETTNNEVGENKTEIDGALSGEPIVIKFNYRYILDSFQSIEADSVVLGLNDSSKPMVIKGVSDDSFSYLVMPMNR